VRKLLPLALAALALAGCHLGGDDEGGSRTTAEPTPISAPGLREHLRALQDIADRSDGTRAAGTPGYDASVRYVADQLRDAGWRVHLDPVSFPYFEERSPPRLDDLRPVKDFKTLSYSGSGRAEGPVVRVGLGCSRSDFDAVVEGEIPVAARGECFFTTKARNAQAAGADALLIVDGESDEPPSATLVGPGWRIPVLSVGARAGQELGPRVRVEVDAVSERRTIDNVIADTANGRGDDVVMAGGHLDSVPAGPGINDNGSGVAALLGLADALGGRAPGAHVRLGFWGAEELGLLGSRDYVRGLDDEERGDISAYLNLDMVGSPKPLRGVYSDADPGIERLLRDLVGPRAEEEGVGGASDHAPFDRAGIRVGGLFTGAGKPNDPCYHRACDTIGNVDLPVLVEMAKVATEAVERLSTGG
jgi:Iap family predicted aminopeptidase